MFVFIFMAPATTFYVVGLEDFHVEPADVIKISLTSPTIPRMAGRKMGRAPFGWAVPARCMHR